ncbi:MAG: hypothetical protein OCD01_14870 [Fibrobacterales bacterium]
MRYVNRFLLLALLTVIAACSLGDPITANSGGTATETEATIVAKIVTPQGEPAVGAQVIIHKQAALSGRDTAIAQLTTDTQGSFSVVVDTGETYLVEANYSEAGLKKGVVFSVEVGGNASYDMGNATLKSLGSVEGVILSPYDSVVVSLVGTQYTASVKEGGVFTIDSIPHGRYLVKAYPYDDPEHSMNTTAEVPGIVRLTFPEYKHTTIIDTPIVVDTNEVDTPVVVVPDDTIVVPVDTVVDVPQKILYIDNFDKKSQKSLFGLDDSSGSWATYSNTSYILPDAGEAQFDIYFDSSEIRGDSGYSFSIYLPGEEHNGVAFSLQMGKNSQEFDLSAVNTINFWAKGSGVITVEFKSEGGSGIIPVALDVPLGADWTLHSLDVTQFSGSQGTTWDDIKSAITHIHFISYTTTTITIDEIRITGVDLLDLEK